MHAASHLHRHVPYAFIKTSYATLTHVLTPYMDQSNAIFIFGGDFVF